MPRTKKFGQVKRRLIRSKTSVNAESERVDVSASKKKLRRVKGLLRTMKIIFQLILKQIFCDKSFCFDAAENKSSRKGLATSVSATCKYCGSGHTSMTSNIVSDGYERVNEAVIENEHNKNIAIALDGTWQKRGHTSKNGVVTATSPNNGKVYRPRPKEDGSKTESPKEQFKNPPSCQTTNRYLDEEGLTDAEILLLQKYYGLAIRRNVGKSVADMSKSIWAIYFHKLSTDENPQQALCPMGEESWCGYNKSIVSVNGDGTWKTRGHTSLIGVCALIGADCRKVLDMEVMSSYCKGCDSIKGQKAWTKI
ncbi:uncharacterized protein TNCV_2171481 [Trichonephila clavipes]|nr:uncharacterized protein TNCV_2171481 [Trichonephila clavipes]